MHFCRPELDIALCLSIIEEHVWIFHSSKVKFVVPDWYSSKELFSEGILRLCQGPWPQQGS